ncbi:MAG: hypothetical protein IBX72_14065 [Nitrospirae bacterium]|nr:hypothetical protein [Nitrospirota bacterium]
MVDSIGRFSIGKSGVKGRKKRNFLQDTIVKMEQWRDKARINIIQQRGRYKSRIKSNRALMSALKEDRAPNLNPTAATTLLGDKSKSRYYGATHSILPLKPKYSLVKPARRIYGNIWKKLEGDRT